MSTQERGFLLIADISGYTTYLTESELEHAHGTLTELLELLIDHTRPPLVVSKLEGDAVVSYGLEDGFLSGQTFVESIEETYIAFRRAIELMVLNNTCRCNACANVSSLDLKFFVHHGSFAFQRLADREELLGTDVVLIHRLLKNSVVDDTGMHAYCLYTDAAAKALGIEEFGNLRRHIERAADIGDIIVWLEDMHPVYEAGKARVDAGLDDAEVLFEVTADVALQPPVLWEYMARPEFRSILNGSDRQEVTGADNGRVGVGSTYHCYHGKAVLPQTVLQWDPFERVVTRDSMGGPFKKSTFVADYRLEPTEVGTRIRRTTGRIEGSRAAAWMMPKAANAFRKKLQGMLDDFVSAVEDDWQTRSGARDIPELSPESVAAAARVGLEGLPGG